MKANPINRPDLWMMANATANYFGAMREANAKKAAQSRENVSAT